MTTYVPKKNDLTHDWYVVDADDIVLGRLSTTVATLLRGKHKPEYMPGADGGDFVIVVNAAKIKLTGNKWDTKLYYRHSGVPGHLKEIPAKKMRDSHPDRVVRFAVWGMLPKNRLGRKMLKRLKVYQGPEHPHEAQQPQAVEVRV